MARRIPVELTLDAQTYLLEARKVEGQTKVVDEIIKGLGRQVDETGHDMTKLAAQTAVAKKEVKDLGDKSKSAATDLEILDRKIAATQRSVRNLGLEFALTGNKVAGERLGRQQSFLSQLQNLRSELEHPTSGAGAGVLSIESLIRDAQKGGQAAGEAFDGGFKGALDLGGAGVSPKSLLIGGLVEAAVIAAPMIGAVLSGAVAGAIGTVGLAGGILAAMHDQSVVAAEKEFLDSIGGKFFGAGAAFVDPIRESLGILKADFDKLDLSGSLAIVAPLVTTIASGLGEMLVKIMPGLNEAFKRMGPYAAVAARGFEATGNAISGFLDDVTRSHGTVEGLITLFTLLSGTIAATGHILKWLSERFHDMNKVAAAAADGVANFIEKATWNGLHETGLHRFADRLNAFADHDAPYAAQSAALLGTEAYKLSGAFYDQTATTEGARKAADDLAKSLGELNQQTEDAISDSLALWSAHIDVAQAMADLNEKLVKGKGNWDLSTQAGRDNQRQLEQTAQTLDRERLAEIKKSDGSVEAINKINTAFDAQLAQIEAVARKAGDSEAALKAMEGTYHIDIIVITDYQERNAQKHTSAADRALLGGRASGGPVVAGGSYLVGEYRPEVFTPTQNGVITPSVQQWNGSSSGGTQRVEVVVSAAPGSDRSVMASITEGLRFDVRTVSGGDPVKHLAPRGR